MLKIILLADLHLGYNIGCSQMKQMVMKVNQQSPDLIVVAGDIFDNEYDALDDPDQLVKIFRQLKSQYGVYAVYGNHDIDENDSCRIYIWQRSGEKRSAIQEWMNL